MCATITPYLFEKIHTHPFNIALGNGTLSMHTFRSFLQQDRLYLLDFSRALQRTAMRLPNPQHQGLFYQLSAEARKTQINLHNKYLLHQQTPTLFQSTQLPTSKIPVIFYYTEHLLTLATRSPVDVAVASLIPCFFIYSTLGLHMRTHITNRNPYRLWIESYSSDQFLLSTQSIIQIINELGGDPGCSDDQIIIAAFIKSIEFEISFWDSIMLQTNGLFTQQKLVM